MTTNGAVSQQDWLKELINKAFIDGKHIAESWSIEHDDGEDGCMPDGWYLIGLDSCGLPITWPVRHEYGPYRTRQQAATIGRAALAEGNK